MRLWLTALLVLTPFLNAVKCQDIGMENARNIQREQLARLQDFLGPPPPKPTAPAKESTISFKNPAAKKFLVDGTKIPDGKAIQQYFYRLVSVV